MVGAAAAAGAAFIGMGVAGARSFIAFEEQMNEVFTLLPGISKDAMNEMTEQVKEFSKEFGTLPEEVVPALYQALSAGVPPDNVFEFLETANKAAIGGVTSLETAVDGITSVVNAYGEDVVDAAQASDLMFTAVRLGKTDFDQLSRSLFNVIPTASATGVAFEDITAGLASMTAQGVPTSVATTQLRQLLVELSRDGGRASEAFKEIAGVGFAEFIAGGKNVADALTVMDEAAYKNGVALQDMFSSVEAGNAALALGGDNLWGFTQNLMEMDEATGATDAAFETMNEGIGRSIARIKAGWEVMLLDIGGRLAPFLSSFATLAEEWMPKFADAVVGAFEAIIAGIGELKTAWDEDYAGMRTTAEEFSNEVPAALGRMWHEIDRIFGDGSMEQEVGWENFLRNILGFLTDFVRFALDTWTEVIRKFGSAWRTGAALLRGDWEGAWDGFKEYLDAWANIILNFVEYVFGPGLRNAMAGAIQNMWDGARAKMGQFQDWWRSSMNSVRNLLPFSEPKDPTSPLRNLDKAGEGMIEQIQKGVDAVSLRLTPQLAASQNFYFQQEFVNPNADVSLARDAARRGVKESLHAKGL